jgi:hypothetical protein
VKASKWDYDKFISLNSKWNQSHKPIARVVNTNSNQNEAQMRHKQFALTKHTMD